MTFRSLSSEIEPACKISVTLPWVHAAGQPYIDWLLGDRSAALQILEQWMRHPSSEVFIGRAVVLVDEAHQVGGFIAVSGSELARCRMHDAVSAVAASTPERRASLLDRLRLGRPLFPEVAADELYLSRVGVHTQARRRGYGKAIVHQYLRHGIRHGFLRFSLDVCSDNVSAIELYRSVGFRAGQMHDVGEIGITYRRMVLEVSNTPERLWGSASRSAQRVSAGRHERAI
jgi:ribosomal protein S18 acetylase RimI-like enzyme